MLQKNGYVCVFSVEVRQFFISTSATNAVSEMFFYLVQVYDFQLTFHCLKVVRIRSYSGPHFPAFGLNTKRYGISLRIQFKCGKIWTRISPNRDTLHAVFDCEDCIEGEDSYQSS